MNGRITQITSLASTREPATTQLYHNYIAETIYRYIHTCILLCIDVHTHIGIEFVAQQCTLDRYIHSHTNTATVCSKSYRIYIITAGIHTPRQTIHIFKYFHRFIIDFQPAIVTQIVDI